MYSPENFIYRKPIRTTVVNKKLNKKIKHVL